MFGVLSGFVGIAVGEGLLDKYLWGEDTIWAAVILVDLFRPPLMMMAFNGTAGCPLSTCLMTREVELRKDSLEPDGGAAEERGPSCCKQVTTLPLPCLSCLRG